MLFTCPSRYSSTIGHTGVFSLGGWSPQLHARTLVPGVTQELHHRKSIVFAYRALTVSGAPSQGTSVNTGLRVCGSYNPSGSKTLGLGSGPVRSPLLRASRLISLPLGTEMVHFPRFASHPYVFRMRYLMFASGGFPHSEIPGSQIACISPRLIAAGHVLHRLLAPRHPHACS